MKKLNSFKILFSVALVLSLASCDKGFVDLNKDPNAILTLDPGFLFSNAEVSTPTGGWENEQTITQQFVNAYNLGATTAFNFNTNNDNFNGNKWGAYGTTLRNLEQILANTQNDPTRNNLYQMSRIWKSYNYMVMVDTYGYAPYSEAEQAYLKNILYPKFDKDADIYTSLYNEIKSAVAALNPNGDRVTADIFFGTLAVGPQVTAWKKIGWSLLLRLGMRYSKVDPAKAQSIVAEAFASNSLMSSNSDNVIITYNGVNNFNNPLNAGPRGINPYYYYVAEPFVTQLKNTNDPRAKYIIGKYANPNAILTTNPDTTLANQVGFPIGYDQNSIKNKSDFQGTASAGSGFKYSQLNYNVYGSSLAPILLITNAETQLLLAEAAFRGWVPGGLVAAITYYNAGIRASMDEMALYPGGAAIPDANYQSYIRQPSVTLLTGNELQKINTQYWIASLSNGAEDWANLRRSGYPVLPKNPTVAPLPGDGYIHRMAYPVATRNTDPDAYNAAVAAMGGDDLTQRVFWDK